MISLKVKLKIIPIMYTNTYFSSWKYKLIWKEKNLNFIIEYNFNDYSMEKINSITWFIIHNIIINK